VSDISLFKFAQLTLLSRPAKNRLVYRTMIRQRSRSIVEIGVGDGQRAQRMLELARTMHDQQAVRYAGIDLFEASPSASLQLKHAYQRLVATGASVTLAPGDPYPALSRVANTLGNTDLVVVSFPADDPLLADAWFYVPRMLHPQSVVLVDESMNNRAAFRHMPREELIRLADSRRTAAVPKAA
jgi:hypothetical protein